MISSTRSTAIVVVGTLEGTVLTEGLGVVVILVGASVAGAIVLGAVVTTRTGVPVMGATIGAAVTTGAGTGAIMGVAVVGATEIGRAAAEGLGVGGTTTSTGTGTGTSTGTSIGANEGGLVVGTPGDTVPPPNVGGNKLPNDGDLVGVVCPCTTTTPSVPNRTAKTTTDRTMIMITVYDDRTVVAVCYDYGAERRVFLLLLLGETENTLDTTTHTQTSTTDEVTFLMIQYPI